MQLMNNNHNSNDDRRNYSDPYDIDKKIKEIQKENQLMNQIRSLKQELMMQNQ